MIHPRVKMGIQEKVVNCGEIVSKPSEESESVMRRNAPMYSGGDQS